MKIEKLSNFSKIYDQYDVFLIDLWGVMHNGIRLNPGAIKTVENLSNNNKKIIFLIFKVLIICEPIPEFLISLSLPLL